MENILNCLLITYLKGYNGNKEKRREKMLKIYAVKKDVEYISFWLRKSDADVEVATRKEDCNVVPIVVQEKYPRTEENG